VTLPIALAGGSFIFLAFVVVLILAVAYGYYSIRGSGIDQHGWKDRDRAFGTGAGKDPTADVRTWGRGSASSRPRRRMTAVEARTVAAIDGRPSGESKGGRIAVSGRYLLAEPVDPARDHLRGSPDAAVMLVVYSEAECRYCKEAHKTVEALRRRFDEHVLCHVVRHFPQEVLHRNAWAAALAAEAAARQDRFWELYDRLMVVKHELDRDTIRKHARAAGLDLGHFDADTQDERLRVRVTEDLDSGLRSGVNGTPTFYINGVRYEDDFEEAELAEAIAAAAQVAT